MTQSTTFKHVAHIPSPPRSRSFRPREGDSGWSVEPGTTAKHAGTWDRAMDGPAPKDAAGDPLGVQWLIIAARLGFALFITAGFAAGLGLSADKTLLNPNSVWAYQAMFFWSLALICCMTSRRP
jgi:hypothetical protein